MPEDIGEVEVNPFESIGEAAGAAFYEFISLIYNRQKIIREKYD